MNIRHDSKWFGRLIHYFLSYEFRYQYLVYQPFALYSTSAHRGMLEINLSNTSTPISCQTIFNRPSNTSRTLSGLPRSVLLSGKHLWRAAFSTRHRCSMGFMSGELGGHSITVNACSLNHSLV